MDSVDITKLALDMPIHMVFKKLSSFPSLSVFMSFIPIEGYFFFVIPYPVNICTTSFIWSNFFYSAFQKHLPVSACCTLFRECLWLLVISLESCYCLWRNHCNTVYLKTMLVLKPLHSDVGAIHWSMFVVFFFEKKSVAVICMLSLTQCRPC